METYRAKAVQKIQALKLRQAVRIGTFEGKVGDYLEFTTGGFLIVHEAAQFESRFEADGLTKERVLPTRVFGPATDEVTVPSVPTFATPRPIADVIANSSSTIKPDDAQSQGATPRQSIFRRNGTPVKRKTNSPPNNVRIVSLLASDPGRELNTGQIGEILKIDRNTVAATMVDLVRANRVQRRPDPNNLMAYLYKAVNGKPVVAEGLTKPKANNPRTICLTDQVVSLIREYGEMETEDVYQFLAHEPRASVSATLSNLTERGRLIRQRSRTTGFYAYSLPKPQTESVA